MIKNTCALTLVAVALTSCAAISTNNEIVHTQALPQFTDICIQKNVNLSNTDEYLSVISKRFEAHNIKTQTYETQKPADCKYTVSYDLERAWDLAPFVSNARLRLFDNGLQIHTVQYQVDNTFDTAKWGKTQTKLEALVDKLITK